MIVILIISLLLECAISNIISLNSIFNPLFLITSLGLLYPYLKKDNTKYLIICSTCGLIYDIIFYNSIFLNTISFFILGLIVILLNKYLTKNILNIVIITIVSIILYRLISYSMVCIIGYTNFNINSLFKSIYTSLIINIIYGIILYNVLKRIKNMI